MKVLVCFKVVPDLEMLSDEDWQVTDNQVDVRFVKTDWNTFDESALEMALKLVDKSSSFNASFELTAVSIGNTKIDPFLKTLMALRFHNAVRIDSDEDLRFYPQKTADWLFDYVKEHYHEVIIMGGQSGVGDNAQTPLMLAEQLGWPCITQVIAIRPEKKGFLRVVNQLDDGEMDQVLQPPVVLAVGNAPNSFLRVPTLKDKMKYGKRAITILPSKQSIKRNNVGLISPSPQLIKMSNVDNRRAGIKIEKGSPSEKAKKLYELYLKERLMKL